MTGPNSHFLYLSFISSWLRALIVLMGFHRFPELQHAYPADSMPLVRQLILHQSRRTGHRPPFILCASKSLAVRSFLLQLGVASYPPFPDQGPWGSISGPNASSSDYFYGFLRVPELNTLLRLTAPVVCSLTPLLSRLPDTSLSSRSILA